MTIFALIDVNSFYCSCEQIFDPRLNNLPIVVASNNDGCAIAINAEAKALGIKMGTPLFKLRDLILLHKVKVFSSNYALYGDMSARAMSVLGQFSPDMEIYSIDECFLKLDGFSHIDLTEYGRKIKAKVLHDTGLPVGVGIGTSKTLSKIASHVAKKRPPYNGVCNISQLNNNQMDELLESIALDDIWGIGRRLAPKLEALGIHNARELKDAPMRQLGKHFSVVLERTIVELRGVSCIPLEELPPARKQIVVSRSFGRSIFDLSELLQSITTYATRAAEKLRRHRLKAHAVSVFAHTHLFKPDEPSYSASVTVPLIAASNDTFEIVNATRQGLAAIYKNGYAYAKSGVMMLDLINDNVFQADLWNSTEENKRTQSLMTVIDQINRKMGSDTVALAGSGINRAWKMKQANLSPRYTTRWSDIPIVKL